MSDALAHFCTLADYNRRFNQRLLDACARLPASALEADRGAFFGSIAGTLDHILLADRIWLGRLQRALPHNAPLAGATVVHGFSGLDQRLTPDLDALRAERARTDAELAEAVAALRPDDLDRVFSYTSSRGLARTLRVGLILLHVFNHQTHHRGQVTTLLFQAGVDPGVTDLLVFATDPGR